jgi:hypothetical protein
VIYLYGISIGTEGLSEGSARVGRDGWSGGQLASRLNACLIFIFEAIVRELELILERRLALRAGTR